MHTQRVLVAGPTASGKSALALRLAEKTGGLIVNADALQVYDCWRILTARPSAEDLAAAEHALYGHVPCREAYSVGAWLRDVAALRRDRPMIFVGGTGLYFTALTQGLAEIPAVPPAVRAEGDALREAKGAEAFRDYVATHDPALWARVDRDNTARLQRAWEVHRATGRPLSAWQAETGPPLVDPTSCLKMTLTSDPDWLRSRIDRRFDQMMQEGALEEIRAMLADWDPARPSSRALGAPELIAALKGEMMLEEAVVRAKTATHQFAKRQRTWFRSKMKDWEEVRSEELAREGGVQRVLSMV